MTEKQVEDRLNSLGAAVKTLSQAIHDLMQAVEVEKYQKPNGPGHDGKSGRKTSVRDLQDNPAPEDSRPCEPARRAAGGVPDEAGAGSDDAAETGSWQDLDACIELQSMSFVRKAACNIPCAVLADAAALRFETAVAVVGDDGEVALCL